ncbi:MAG: YfiR family protein [Bacteroidetes bacterium]|nr:YfiR family protein [Bacteroidota bacterium]
MKKILLILFLPITLFVMRAMVAPDQGEEANAKIKAIYIYNFTKYIEWPQDYKTGNFIVGVLGSNSSLLGELNKMASAKTVGTQKFEIKNIASAAEATNCHIVYILNDKSTQLADVVGKVKGKSALIVTDKEGLASKGAAINFVIVENKQKIELNKSNIERYKLKVAEQLVSMAVPVK